MFTFMTSSSAAASLAPPPPASLCRVPVIATTRPRKLPQPPKIRIVSQIIAHVNSSVTCSVGGARAWLRAVAEAEGVTADVTLLRGEADTPGMLWIFLILATWSFLSTTASPSASAGCGSLSGRAGARRGGKQETHTTTAPPAEVRWAGKHYQLIFQASVLHCA